MGHALVRIKVKQLSKELTKTRTKRTGRTPTHEKGDERETMFTVDYESENDPINPHKWSLWTELAQLFSSLPLYSLLVSRLQSTRLP